MLVEKRNIRDPILGQNRDLITPNVNNYLPSALFRLELGQINLLPIRINASAIKAVPESLAKFLIIESGMKTISWAKMRYLTGIKVRQLLTAIMNAWRFSAMKME